MLVTFVLDGLEFQALNGGPEFAFTEAISLFVSAVGQEEVDHFWDKLTSDGGAPGQCGWLKDKRRVKGRRTHGSPEPARRQMPQPR